MKKAFLLLSFLAFVQNIFCQTIKGLYVDGFATILGNTQREDSLLRFAQNNGFNYLTLYDMHIVHANTPLNNASACTTFTNFISKAKTQFGIMQIGVAGENYNFFANNIFPYNQQHALASEKIDVYNLEFEFWVPSSINPGGVYCIDYLTNAGYTCDSAGAFIYYKKMLSRIDSLANADGKISETYFGWFSATEGTQIVASGVDRILLSVYLPSGNYNASYQYNYLENRLANLGNNNTTVKVLPIYSAEPSFMKSWANTNPFFKPFTDLQNSLMPLSFGWVPNIQLEGIQWFAYSDMPKKNMALSINKISKDKITIYPNPCNDYLLIESEINNSTIKITDCFGKIIFTKNNIALIEKINLASVANGIYYLRIENDKTICNRKIIVSR
jgi:Secretion system C-terminal sorting domain